MIVADTSAWVELFRDTGDPAGTTLARLLDEDEDVALTEVIVMELLAGARARQPLRELRLRLLAFPILPLRGLADFEEAAFVYRACREAGETIRSLTDCLIAVASIREAAAILHKDADFDAIARHSDLEVYALST